MWTVKKENSNCMPTWFLCVYCMKSQIKSPYNLEIWHYSACFHSSNFFLPGVSHSETSLLVQATSKRVRQIATGALSEGGQCLNEKSPTNYIYLAMSFLKKDRNVHNHKSI